MVSLGNEIWWNTEVQNELIEANFGLVFRVCMTCSMKIKTL